ncbi:MAG TPA: ribose-phosphate pyrophosphokinase [Chloroflexia bacterium]|nr:ribose-phosphate pyrophosphokinase [Chloroflexia bacterium]
MRTSNEELIIFSGNANPALARAVCAYLGIPLGQADVFSFSNENIFVKLNESVRANDVFIIQPTCSPVNRSIMELLIMIDAVKRASANRVTAVLPYYAYGRTDKKDQPRVPITARLIADLITVAGAHRVLTVDLHAGQIQGFFNLPVDELTAVYLLARHFRDKQLPNPVVVSTDIGNAKRARNFAELVGAPLAIIEKRRLGNDGRTEALNLIGNVQGHQAILVDDEVDTGGSITQAARQVVDEGATVVYACCVHPVLSGPAIERLQASPISEIVTTDTIPIPPEKQIAKMITLSVAPLIGEAIQRVHSGASVGMMFDNEREAVDRELARRRTEARL